MAEFRNVAYFTAAGNFGMDSYQTTYQGTACPSILLQATTTTATADDDDMFVDDDYYISGMFNDDNDDYDGASSDEGDVSYLSCHDFDGNGRATQRLVLSDVTVLVLQWDESFLQGSTNDVDVWVFEAETGMPFSTGVEENIGFQPMELVVLPPGSYDIVIPYYKGKAPPNLIKWVAYPSGSNTDDLVVSCDPHLNAPTLSNQANTPFTAGVGAIFDQQTFGQLQLESFSSVGGTPMLFDRNGSRKKEPLVSNQPRFVGPDGYVTLSNNDDSDCTVLILFWRFWTILSVSNIGHSRFNFSQISQQLFGSVRRGSYWQQGLERVPSLWNVCCRS